MPAFGNADWQLNTPRSIRDIVRRERWAAAYSKAIAEHVRDDKADVVTIRIRLPAPAIDCVYAQLPESYAKDAWVFK